MTRYEAEREWDETKDMVLAQLFANDIEAPDKEFIELRHQAFVFDRMSGEFTPNLMVTRPGRLKFWHEKLKDYRLTGGAELTRYILDRIQEVRRGI